MSTSFALIVIRLLRRFSIAATIALAGCGSGGSEALVIGLIGSQLKNRGPAVVRDLFLRETMTLEGAAALGAAPSPAKAGGGPCVKGGTAVSTRTDGGAPASWEAGDSQSTDWIDCDTGRARVSGSSSLQLAIAPAETLVIGFDDLVAVNPFDGSVTRYDGSLRFEVSETSSAIVAESLTVSAIDSRGTSRVEFTGLEMRIGEQGEDLFWIVNGSFARQENGGPVERMRIVTEEAVVVTPGELCPIAGRVRFESETGDVLTVSFAGLPTRLRLSIDGLSVSIPCADAV